MNILEGLQMQGLTLTTEDNFNSIPGLKTWLDGRDRIIKNGSSIELWGDKSARQSNFYQYKENRQPEHDNNLWVNSNCTTASEFLISNNRDVKFLHNGAPMALYAILKLRVLDANTGFTLFTSAKSDQHGFRVLFSAAGGGRIITNCYNAGVQVRSVIISNVSTTYPNEALVVFKYIWRGVGVANNLTHQLGTINQTITSVASSFSTSSPDGMLMLGNANAAKPFKCGLFLMYDWTGYLPDQITGFDDRIMNLLNTEKLIFEELDA